MVLDQRQSGENLASLIHACIKCEALTGGKRVRTDLKKIPFDYGEPYHSVQILFVAESPSTSGKYYYRNTSVTNPSTLRAVLFRQLVASGLMSKPTFDDFRLAFYLADVVKCPFMNVRNNRNSAPSQEAIKNCNAFLIEEIKLMQPQIVCALGKSALRGFVSENRFKLKECLGQVPRERLERWYDELQIPLYACYFPTAMVPWDGKINALRELT